MRRTGLWLPLAVFLAASISFGDSAATQPASPETLHFTTRTRHELTSKSGRYEVVEQNAQWDPKHTALIICDLWDKHWCQGATQRCGEMRLESTPWPMPFVPGAA